MKVGSLVKCVNGDWDIEPGITYPSKGCIYTIRGFDEAGGDVGLFLEEIVNQKKRFRNGIVEPAFWDKMFREVQPPIDLEFINELQQEKILVQTV